MKKFKSFIFAFCALVFFAIGKFVKTFSKNVQTATVLQGLQDGNNSIAEYTSNYPELISNICMLIGVLILIFGFVYTWKQYKILKKEEEK